MEHTEISKVWPEWHVVEQIGEGSYGVVYKAVRREHGIESFSAIKVISVPQSKSELNALHSEGLSLDETKTYFEGVVNDFINEIRVMGTLKGHPNIVNVEDYKVVENSERIGWDIYIRMELLTPFDQYILDKKFTEQEIIDLGSSICTALEVCHEKGIIHRDVKPENIFINEFGSFKLGDFGVARKLENISGSMSQKGTYHYMAPEVANGTHYDARVDIYSLGIVLYRLLNENHLPFLDTEEQIKDPFARKQALERRLKGEALPVPKGASPEMARVILQACAADPEQRYQTPEMLRNALQAVGSGESPAGLNETVMVHRPPVSPDRTMEVRPPQGNIPVGPVTDQGFSMGAGPNPLPPSFGGQTKERSIAPKIVLSGFLIALALISIIAATMIVTLKAQDDREQAAEEERIAQQQEEEEKKAEEERLKAEEEARLKEEEEARLQKEKEEEEKQQQREIDLANLEYTIDNYLNAYIDDINGGRYRSLYSVVEYGSNLEKIQKKFLENSDLYEELINYEIISYNEINENTYHVTTIEDYDVYSYESEVDYHIRQKCVYKVSRQTDDSWRISDYAENVEQLEKDIY